MLDISSGDAMQVKFEPFNSDITIERLAQQMVDRGYNPTVAAVLAASTAEMNELRSPMRVDDATIDYGIDSGIMITATLRNFVNIFVQEEEA